MIEFYPNKEEISQLNTPLMDGEKDLLRKLQGALSKKPYAHRTFRIYIQPNLFFGKPDIVIVEPKYGVWIIEVKDYIPDYYELIQFKGEEKTVWQVKNQQNAYLKENPIEQVERYKSNLFEFLGSDELLENAKYGGRYGLTIRSAVYFSKFDERNRNKVSDFLDSEYTTILIPNDFDNENTTIINRFFQQIKHPDYRLSEDTCTNIHSILNPGEMGRNKPLPDFEGDYASYTRSEPRRRRFKGSAGTGKSTILAKRVANASKRLEKDEKILVVFYNITMGNYLQDKIKSEGGSTLNKMGVDLRNVHSLYNWKKDSKGRFSIESKAENTDYSAIFIDEAQDFKSEWFNKIRDDYGNEPNTKDADFEYIVFADDNQNIYGVETENDVDGDPLPVVNIPGQWNKLDRDYRHANPKMKELSEKFAVEYFNKPAENAQLTLDYFGTHDSYSKIYYRNSMGQSDEQMLAEAVRYIQFYAETMTKDFGASINDLVVLGDNVEFLRDVEENLRQSPEKENKFSQTSTTFTTNQEIHELKNVKEKAYKGYQLERAHKLAFFRNQGVVKFSTIHSFKGWEAPFVVLLLTDPNTTSGEDYNYDNLVYTGITRATKGIFIYNRVNKYNDFFANNADKFV